MAEIDRLAKTHPWDWVITFHPKLTDPGIIAGYKRIAEENENVIFYEGSDKMPLLQQADVMLCDSSSIILEFMFLDKPVVTFRNSHPGPHLIDVDTPEAVGPAIERALMRPEGLMGRAAATPCTTNRTATAAVRRGCSMPWTIISCGGMRG